MKLRVLLSSIAATLLLSGYPAVPPPLAQPPARASRSIWKKFNSTQGRFAVLMPGTPKRERKTQNTKIGPINIQAFAVERRRERVAYIVAYFDFPKSFVQKADVQKLFDGARDGALKSAEGQLLGQRDISLSGYPGREIEFVNSKGLITKNRLYLVDRRLYQVIVLTTQQNERNLSKSIEGFMNSFKLVSQR